MEALGVTLWHAVPVPLNKILAWFLLQHTNKNVRNKEGRVVKLHNSASLHERIRSDSLQLFFRCYYYFAPAVFVVQCISVGYQEQDVVA